RLRAAARIGGLELGGATHCTHPATATARDRLDHDRPCGAERGKEMRGLFQRRGAVGARQYRNLALERQAACASLVAEHFKHLGGRADEANAGKCALTSEIGVLAQEAVAGMNGVAARGLRHADDLRCVEIGGWPPPSQRVRTVSFVDMVR